MLTDNNGSNMYMPVAPAYNGGNGMFGDGSFWIIVLFLFALMGGNGWGNGFGGGTSYQVDAQLQRGFDQQSVMAGLNGIQAGINSLAQSQCQGNAGITAAVNQGFFNAETAAQARQMAGMQQDWNTYSALDSRLDTLAMNQQNCCCENRQAIADVKYAIATDGAQTRSNTDAKIQGIYDKLCQMEMDGIKQNYENQIANMKQDYESQIRDLTGRVNALDRAASANAQTATIQAGQRALANEVEQYVLPTPRPAYIVQNPNCCPSQQTGCCGNFNGFVA